MFNELQPGQRYFKTDGGTVRLGNATQDAEMKGDRKGAAIITRQAGDNKYPDAIDAGLNPYTDRFDRLISDTARRPELNHSRMMEKQ